LWFALGKALYIVVFSALAWRLAATMVKRRVVSGAEFPLSSFPLLFQIIDRVAPSWRVIPLHSLGRVGKACPWEGPEGQSLSGEAPPSVSGLPGLGLDLQWKGPRKASAGWKGGDSVGKDPPL